MIATNSAFNAANAPLNKKPIFALYVSGYSRIFATKTCTGTLYPFLGWGGLCGAFTDGSGNVVQPVPIGNRGQFKTPAGATQFQIGINDQQPFDNLGSLLVRVNGVPINVPGTTPPWDPHLAGNAAYNFGTFIASPAPVIIAASGLSTGDVVTVSYVSGLVNAQNGFPSRGPDTDGDGDLGNVTGAGTFGIGVLFPTAYMGVSTVVPWVTNIDDLDLTVSDLDGSADLADLSFNVQDVLQAITADFPSFIFEGKPCLLLAGFTGMTLGQFVTLFTGVVTSVDSDNSNTEYKFTASSFNLKKLSAKIFTVSDADANGNTFTTDSNHPRSLSGHPLDILVSALQEAGVSLGLIDTGKIHYYRDFIFSGLTFVFSLTEAPTAKNFIEDEIMKPMGMYLWENNLGKMSVSSFYPAIFPFGGYTPVTPPVATLDIDNTTDIPLAKEDALVNQMIFKFDDDGSGQNLAAENIAQYDESVDKYGLTDGQTIESKGMRSAFQGYYHAELISFLIFLRYGLKNLMIEGLPALWSECVLEPGDVIALTEPFVPDRQAGALGVTGSTFEVLGRKWRFMQGITEVKLLALDLTKFKQFLITPNGEADFAADTAPNQAKYLYLADAAGKYSTGVAANTMG